MRNKSRMNKKEMLANFIFDYLFISCGNGLNRKDAQKTVDYMYRNFRKSMLDWIEKEIGDKGAQVDWIMAEKYIPWM